MVLNQGVVTVVKIRFETSAMLKAKQQLEAQLIRRLSHLALGQRSQLLLGSDCEVSVLFLVKCLHPAA